MLRLRQIIPPLTARAADGRTVRAWDYKQKKNLVIAFLHARCAPCDAFLEKFAARTTDLAEREAIVFAVYDRMPQPRVAADLPPQIVLASDVSGRSQRAYLGKDAFGPAGQDRVGVFVADRYGELYAQWESPTDDGLPGAGETLEWLAQIQVACEECGASHWLEES